MRAAFLLIPPLNLLSLPQRSRNEDSSILIVNNLLGLFIDESFSAERTEKLSLFISKVIFRGIEPFHALWADEPKNPCHGNYLLRSIP